MTTYPHSNIRIGSLLDPRLRMRRDINIPIYIDGLYHVATCRELDEFGYGNDPIMAVQDLRRTIAELYWSLKQDKNRLGNDLNRVWGVISTLIYEACEGTNKW